MIQITLGYLRLANAMAEYQIGDKLLRETWERRSEHALCDWQLREWIRRVDAARRDRQADADLAAWVLFVERRAA